MFFETGYLSTLHMHNNNNFIMWIYHFIDLDINKLIDKYYIIL